MQYLTTEKNFQLAKCTFRFVSNHTHQNPPQTFDPSHTELVDIFLKFLQNRFVVISQKSPHLRRSHRNFSSINFTRSNTIINNENQHSDIHCQKAAKEPRRHYTIWFLVPVDNLDCLESPAKPFTYKLVAPEVDGRYVIYTLAETLRRVNLGADSRASAIAQSWFSTCSTNSRHE